MSTTLIADMSDRAKARLIEQFKNSINVNLMVELFAEELQELEDSTIDVLNELTISSATGVNLDIVGEHLGRKRSGELDAAYRDLLRLQIGINSSEGTEKVLYDLFILLTSSTFTKLTEIFPAEIKVFGNGVIVDTSIITELQKIVAATIKISFVLSGGGVPFAFEGGEVNGGGFTSLHTADPVAAGDGVFSTLISGV